MSEIPLYIHVTASKAAATAFLSNCRGTSLIRNSADFEPYIKAMPRAVWWS